MKTIWPIIAFALAALGLAIILTGCATSRPDHVEYMMPEHRVVIGTQDYINARAKEHNVPMGLFGVNGFYDAFGATVYVRYDSDYTSSTMPRLETFGHEEGHVIYWQVFYK